MNKGTVGVYVNALQDEAHENAQNITDKFCHGIGVFNWLNT
jgi:hypothetical protein